MPERQTEKLNPADIWNRLSRALRERLGKGEEAEIKSTFRTLTEPSQKLLISMAHFSEWGGDIAGVKSTSRLPDQELQKAMDELQERSLLEQGKLLREGKFKVIGFQQDPEGDRFRLPKDIQTAVLKDILKLEEGPWFP